MAIDVSNRPYLVWRVDVPKPKLGEMDTELFKEWFQAFAQNAGICLHVENLYGENSHHIVESCFKGRRARCGRRSRPTSGSKAMSRRPRARWAAPSDRSSNNQYFDEVSQFVTPASFLLTFR